VTARQVEKRLGSYAYIDNSRARAELGFAPRPLEQSLRDLLLWSARVGRIPSGIAPAS
jgi:nucleoside-diphosphate-sugar epimerase